MKNVAEYFLLMTLMCACSTTKPVDIQLCPNIVIHASEKIELSDTEKQLLCGDPSDAAYNIVPVYQAKYMLQGFLQSRGFSGPRFIYEKNTLTVFTEDKSHVQSIEVRTTEPSLIDEKLFEKEIYRRYKKETITPKLLDEIEAKARSMARNLSFPCVKVTSAAEPGEGKILITLNSLIAFPFGALERDEIEGVKDAALERFNSFSATDPFRESELLLTEKRYLRQGVVQGTYFQENCNLKDQQFSLHQKFIVGPPRTIRFGAGASTELGPMIRASWSHQRFLEMASVLEARIQASLKNQALILSAEQYFWESKPRQSLNTDLRLERNDQQNFTESTATLRPLMQWTHDSEKRFWLWSSGPSFITSTYKTGSSATDRSFKTVAIEGALQSKTHSYEIFDIHPEVGEFYQFNYDFRHPTLGFSDRLLKLDLSYLNFFWLGPLGKGNTIAGIRLGASSTWVKDAVAIQSLPPSVKYYGGGSDDLRGFELNTLPDNSGLGALSKVSAKFELRKTHLFEPNLEGFLFLDNAYFGERSWKLNSRLWYSPGLGVRWLSPIGLVQTYLARSLTNRSSDQFDQDQGLFFYFGLGGVF